ncbi:MAG: 2-keto-3-deoxy-L-rhamnonate aldolase [Verrucomicrobiae bacterium]|nr:2-keto-3-deoxy-L-rhamnonate aldolase [Verrucomicrobiae bacterium]
MIDEKLLTKLHAGDCLFGISLRYNDAAIIETIGPGWDFCWIDLQHGAIQPDRVLEIVRACAITGTAPFIRLGRQSQDLLGFALDLAVAGVIVAQVDTVEHAAAAVAAAKFPPLGDRSFGGRRICDRHGTDYVLHANQRQLLLVQMESPLALENCEKIAALDGVDGLMIGPDDMAIRLGIPRSSPLEGPVGEATRRIATAARGQGKVAMGFGGAAEKDIRAAVTLGLNMISMGADVSFLRQGMAAWTGAVRTYKENQ